MEGMEFRRLVDFFLLCCLCTVPTTNGANIGHFWHVTDFHYDHTYWSDQLSCNNDVTQPGVFGDYWCDSPWRLIADAIRAMTQIHPDVDFLIWTGDTVAHIQDSHLSVDINMDSVQNLTTAITEAFPNKTVYATFGNHDYYPTNQYPATVRSTIYNRTAAMWGHWISEPDQLDSFRKGGYYTRLTESGLRIVALNTNLYYTSDKQTPGHADPAEQFLWFRTVMEAASSAGEKVIVIAHIPPGVHTPRGSVWFHQEFVQPFNSILTRFAHSIVAMHFGHDHHDGFKVLYDEQGHPAAPILVAPSVTPWRYKLPTGEIGPSHNPAIRLVTFDRDTGRPLQVAQYRLDLPASNRQQQQQQQQQSGADPSVAASFQLLYSFTQHYGVADLSAASLHELTSRLTSHEGQSLLNDYYRFTTTGAEQEGDRRQCDHSCQARIVCGFRVPITMAEFISCVTERCGATCVQGGQPIG